MRDVGLTMTRALDQGSFKSAVDELLNDKEVLTEMAARAGATAETPNLMSYAYQYVLGILAAEMVRSSHDMSAAQARTLDRLHLEAEEIRRNPKPTVCPLPPQEVQVRRASDEKPEPVSPAKVEVPLAQGHGSVVDTKPLPGGGEIRLYEDEYFEIIGADGRQVEPSQVSMRKQGWFNFITGKVTHTFLWIVATRLLGKAANTVAPGIGTKLQGAELATGIAAESATSIVQDVAASKPSHLLTAPLFTPVPPVGTVDVVIYVDHDDGSIDRLSFGWTPDKNLFLVGTEEEQGWYRYKEADRKSIPRSEPSSFERPKDADAFGPVPE